MKQSQEKNTIVGPSMSYTNCGNLQFCFCCFFQKDLQPKKSTKWKKKPCNISDWNIRVRVDKIQIPCFRELNGSWQRRSTQLFVFWAVTKPAFWCRNFNSVNTKNEDLLTQNFFFLLVHLNVSTNQVLLLKSKLPKPAQHYCKRFPR